MWQAYRDNAVENLDSAKILFDNKYFTTSYECSFFALEIILKAWIVQNEPPELNNIKYPRYARDPFFDHDILRIFDAWPNLEKMSRKECPREYNLLLQTLRYKQHWKPWKRYRYKASKSLALKEYKIAEGLQKWMLTVLERA